VGNLEKERLPKTNTSFRLITSAVDLKDEPLVHKYTVFLGPKKKDILAAYNLGELMYYGQSVRDGLPIKDWQLPNTEVARLMVRILQFFYWLIPNYGIAIILLTVLVRLCMFPLSRKQALGAQKMQKLQPELKRLTEKYKNDYEGR